MAPPGYSRHPQRGDPIARARAANPRREVGVIRGGGPIVARSTRRRQQSQGGPTPRAAAAASSLRCGRGGRTSGRRATRRQSRSPHQAARRRATRTVLRTMPRGRRTRRLLDPEEVTTRPAAGRYRGGRRRALRPPRQRSWFAGSESQDVDDDPGRARRAGGGRSLPLCSRQEVPQGPRGQGSAQPIAQRRAAPLRLGGVGPEARARPT